MKLSAKELSYYLKILELDSIDIATVTLKQASQAFMRLAILTHPDKAGEKSTAEFQKVRDAYEKIRNHLSECENTTTDIDESNFFEDNFKC